MQLKINDLVSGFGFKYSKINFLCWIVKLLWNPPFCYMHVHIIFLIAVN